jgi:DMSO/TMAO reductase YedYZ molybdopterin-dependent catalytic subunit
MKEEMISEAVVKRRTLLAFFVFILTLVAATIGWYSLRKTPKENNAEAAFRNGLQANESFFYALFSQNRLAKTYPVEAAAKRARVNGWVGLGNNFDSAQWALHVVRKPGDTLLVSLDELKALPKTEIVFDFKCIEGWSQVSHWGGVKFSDFVVKYQLQDQTKLLFTGLRTPDGAYYVGIDNKSMMHPQTLLCYELNGKPLPMNQGYPLRLIIPVKYGVKHLKRIGTVNFSNVRPPDYWYERGYDYYCGL